MAPSGSARKTSTCMNCGERMKGHIGYQDCAINQAKRWKDRNILSEFELKMQAQIPEEVRETTAPTTESQNPECGSGGNPTKDRIVSSQRFMNQKELKKQREERGLEIEHEEDWRTTPKAKYFHIVASERQDDKNIHPDVQETHPSLEIIPRQPGFDGNSFILNLGGGSSTVEQSFTPGDQYDLTAVQSSATYFDNTPAQAREITPPLNPRRRSGPRNVDFNADGFFQSSFPNNAFSGRSTGGVHPPMQVSNFLLSDRSPSTLQVPGMMVGPSHYTTGVPNSQVQGSDIFSYAGPSASQVPGMIGGYSSYTSRVPTSHVRVSDSSSSYVGPSTSRVPGAMEGPSRTSHYNSFSGPFYSNIQDPLRMQNAIHNTDPVMNQSGLSQTYQPDDYEDVDSNLYYDFSNKEPRNDQYQ